MGLRTIAALLMGGLSLKLRYLETEPNPQGKILSTFPQISHENLLMRFTLQGPTFLSRESMISFDELFKIGSKMPQDYFMV